MRREHSYPRRPLLQVE
ncbi:hypothetical protein A2U01_0089742, partial [Trifolium medium]|nr:hypothetical protein [Trifolium medium]